MAKYQRKEREAVLLHCFNYRDIRRDFSPDSVLRIIDSLVEYSICEKEGREFVENLTGPEMYGFRTLKATADEGISSFNHRRDVNTDNRFGGQRPTMVDDRQPPSTMVDNIKGKEKENVESEKENENFPSRFDFLRSSFVRLGLVSITDKDLNQWINKYTDDQILYAFNQAKARGKDSAAYIQGILSKCGDMEEEYDQDNEFSQLFNTRKTEDTYIPFSESDLFENHTCIDYEKINNTVLIDSENNRKVMIHNTLVKGKIEFTKAEAEQLFKNYTWQQISNAVEQAKRKGVHSMAYLQSILMQNMPEYAQKERG